MKGAANARRRRRSVTLAAGIARSQARSRSRHPPCSSVADSTRQKKGAESEDSAPCADCCLVSCWSRSGCLTVADDEDLLDRLDTGAEVVRHVLVRRCGQLGALHLEAAQAGRRI